MTYRLHAFATLFLALSVLPAAAASYDVQPLKDGDKFIGCMAVNQGDGLVLLAVENGLAILLSSPEFKVVKGDAVTGSWSIDNSKSRPLSERANGDGTISIDLELTKADFLLIGDGDELEVNFGKVSKTFSLAGSSKGLAGLSSCMSKNGK